MQHNSNDNLVLKWLSNAHSDLLIAGIELPEGALYEQLCFHTQQAAEKSLKALLLYLNIDFPFTHNIGLLISFLPTTMQSIPELCNAAILTPYAVITRYPGEVELVSKEDYEESIDTASTIFNWINEYITNNLSGK